MPQVNEFSWFLSSAKLILFMLFIFLYLNYIFSFNFFSNYFSKKLFYSII